MSRWLIILVLLLAVGLRWWQIDLVDYKYDEAHIMGMAQGVAKLDGYFPIQSGGTSQGLPRGALDVYLLAIPLLLTGGRVEAAVWIIGALGVLAIALTYALSKRIATWLIDPDLKRGARERRPKVAGLASPFSIQEMMDWDAQLHHSITTKVQCVALVAALYMAANPWLVYLDRKVWAHIQVLFSVVLLWLAWQVVVERHVRSAFNFVLIAALQLFSHVLALVQGLSWLAALLIAPRRWWNRYLLAGVFVGAIFLLPYAGKISERIQQASVDGGSALKLSNPTVTLQVDSGNLFASKGWQLGRQLLTGSGLPSVVGQTEDARPGWALTRILSPLLLLLLGVGVLRIGWSIFRPTLPNDAMGGLLLLVWVIGPILVFSLFSEQLFLQYWTVLLPWPAIVLGLGVESLIDWIDVKRRMLQTSLVLGLGVLLVGLALVWSQATLDLLGVFERGEGGSPLRFWSRALQQVHTTAKASGTNEVRVAVHGVDPGYDGEPAIVATLIGNPPFARFVAPASPPALLFSYDRPSLYFVGFPKAESEFAETERSMQQWGELVWQGDVSRGELSARLYRLPTFAATGFNYMPVAGSPTFDAGMQLLGYRFPEVANADQPVVVTLIWHVLEPPNEVRQRDLTAFNHVLTRDGGMAAQVDGLALLSRDWWPGDVLVQSYTVTLPAGDYVWRTGLYSRVDGARSITDAGSDVVDLPGFTIR
ncbi:MAG: hypothetical protein U0175_03035 [Caldilineaceae bacterium]